LVAWRWLLPVNSALIAYIITNSASGVGCVALLQSTADWGPSGLFEPARAVQVVRPCIVAFDFAVQSTDIRLRWGLWTRCRSVIVSCQALDLYQSMRATAP
jgi:hypothetical protein